MGISCRPHWQSWNKNQLKYFMLRDNLPDHRAAHLSNRKLISEEINSLGIVWGEMLQRQATLCSPKPLDYNSHNPLPLAGAYGKHCLFINQPPHKMQKVLVGH